MKTMEATTASGEKMAAEIGRQLGASPDFCSLLIRVADGLGVHCLFLSSITTTNQVDEMIVKPLRDACLRHDPVGEGRPDWLSDAMPLAKRVDGCDAAEGMKRILDGSCLLIPQAGGFYLSYDVAKGDFRSVEEPKSESAIRGPREGFVEDIRQNVALIRKRLKNPSLTFEPYEFGTETGTKVYMAYLANAAAGPVVDEFRRRLSQIKTDSVLESAYIEEFIQDKTLSPFPQLISTERPDAVASRLLEGGVAVMIDGTPMVLVGPVTFFQLFSSSEDYYQRADIATLLRWLRMLAFLLSIFVPSLYIAVASYHQELLPTSLLINLAAQREEVPFPAVVEALLMLVTFEILREAGLRMPRIAGQAISIVGALVIGQAAVEAGLVSAAMVIVVSLTAIANYVSPSYSFGIAQRILQLFFMLLSGFMGLFGILCGVFFMLVHLVSLRSFGVKYMSPLAPSVPADWKDTLVRVPRKWMTNQIPRTFLFGKRK